MKHRDFKKLNARKDAQTIKEEYMKGRHSKLTPRQLEIICKKSRDGGGICFGKKMSTDEMIKRQEELEQKRGNKKIKSIWLPFNILNKKEGF